MKIVKWDSNILVDIRGDGTDWIKLSRIIRVYDVGRSAYVKTDSEEIKIEGVTAKEIMSSSFEKLKKESKD